MSWCLVKHWSNFTFTLTLHMLLCRGFLLLC